MVDAKKLEREYIDIQNAIRDFTDKINQLKRRQFFIEGALSVLRELETDKNGD